MILRSRAPFRNATGRAGVTSKAGSATGLPGETTGTLPEARATASRPGGGLATHHDTGVNQRGEKVFEFTGSAFWQREAE